MSWDPMREAALAVWRWLTRRVQALASQVAGWVKENPRSLHVYPGTLLLGWASWRLGSAPIAAVVVGALLIYFGAFWRPPGAKTVGE